MVFEVACPSPMGVMFRGTGLLLGGILGLTKLSDGLSKKAQCNQGADPTLPQIRNLPEGKKKKRSNRNRSKWLMSWLVNVSRVKALFGACQFANLVNRVMTICPSKVG